MRLLRLLVISASTAMAADMTGHWSVDGNLNGNPVSFDCVFQQVEKKLTGACKAYEFAVTATGTVEEGRVQFSYIYKFAGEPYKCTYTGLLTGDSEVKGSIIVAGIDGTKGEFVAKKSQALP